MPRFRKKPVEIEAVQWTGDNVDEVREFLGFMDRTDEDAIPVTTIHGDTAFVRLRDWIIPEPQPGRFYPCKPDIFEATYEQVESGSDA
jgi:hypothetical protein